MAEQNGSAKQQARRKNSSGLFERIIISQSMLCEPGKQTKFPILEACERNLVKRVSKILEEKGDPNVDDKDGWTPLHWAARYRNKEMVKALIDSKAEIDPRNRSGQTPLHFAVDKLEGDLEIAKMLIHAGADPNLRDAHHNTPYEIAVLEDNEPMAHLLSQAGADPTTFRKPIKPQNSIRAMRVMNRAKAKLTVSYEIEGRTKRLELGPGNAERIPVDCQLVMRSKHVQASPEKTDQDVEFITVSKDRRIMILNLKSDVVSGMQCMIYVTPKDHPRNPFKCRLSVMHATTAKAKRLQMSSEADNEAKTGGNPTTQSLRMICIGSWGEGDNPEVEAHRLFLKYALHQQKGKKLYQSNTIGRPKKSSTKDAPKKTVSAPQASSQPSGAPSASPKDAKPEPERPAAKAGPTEDLVAPV